MTSPYLPSKDLYWLVTSSLSISKLLGLSTFTFQVFVLVCHIFPVHIKTSWPHLIYLQSICIGLSHLPYPYQNFSASPYLLSSICIGLSHLPYPYRNLLTSPYLPSKDLYWLVASSLSISKLLGLSIFTFKVSALVCHSLAVHIKTSWPLRIYFQSIFICSSHLPCPYQNFLVSPYLPSMYLYWFVTSSLSISKRLGLSIFTFKVSVLVCHIFPVHIKTSWPLHIYLQSICIGLSHLPYPYQNFFASPYLPSKYLYWFVISSLSISKLLGLSIFTFKLFVLVCHIFPIHIKTSWPLHVYLQSICIGLSHLPSPYQNFLASPYLLSKYLYWFVISSLSISKPRIFICLSHLLYPYQNFLASPYLPSKYLYWFVISSLSISKLLGLSMFTFKVFPCPYQNFLTSPYLPSKYLYWFVTPSLSISKLLGLSIFTFKVSVLVCPTFRIHIKTSWPLHIFLQSVCISLSHLPYPVTPKILDLCDQRRDLNKKIGEPEGTKDYREFKRKIRSEMKMAKETWILGQCHEVEACLRKNNSKKTYKLVKDLTTEKQSKSTTIKTSWGSVSQRRMKSLTGRQSTAQTLTNMRLKETH